AGPQSVFIQLQALLRWIAEHHGADAPITHGQRLDPFGCRVLVPQGQGIRTRPSRGASYPLTGQRTREPTCQHPAKRFASSQFHRAPTTGNSYIEVAIGAAVSARE